MQINKAALAALFRGYRVIYDAAFHGSAPESTDLYMVTQSNAAEELYHWLGAFPGMKKLVGEVVIENVAANKFAIANEEFESTVSVKRADIERNAAGIYNPLFSGMGAAAAEHPDEMLASLLENAFTDKDYTGTAFFAANKPHEPGNNKSTKFTNKGTKKLAASSYSEAKAAFKSLKNAYGRPMGIGRNLTLVVSPDKEDAAREILVATRNAAGADNIHQGTATLKVLSRLSGEAWFLMDLSRPVRPFILQKEVPIEFNSLTTEESDHVFLKKEYLYQAYGRYNAGYGLPQLAWGSDGTTDPS
ncbi:phage major head subunit gpT-like protein [Haloferula luteola]|uniref:Phage major head subunit gpT-like protein n=1 Tax=Haloferula luteola TaxID=595692 RepID=A0A840UZ98_9BACT|nr:Mu-like prophage major head subunit gpT family protein [Haloferula luteola]MBB5351102.1 phage major head subunit gpT-like protein [Haloferula luteola]